MFLRIFLITGCCWLALTSGVRGSEMDAIINGLFQAMDTNKDERITRGEMAMMYHAMALKGGKLTEDVFIPAWKAMTHQSTELAKAYFAMADTDHNKILNNLDSDTTFNRFDADNDNFVSKEEFVKRYSMMFCTAPFVVLYQTTKEKYGLTGELSKEYFEKLFDTLKLDPNSLDKSVSKKTLEDVWVSRAFGTKEDADRIVAALDMNTNDHICQVELGSLFDALDQNGDSQVGIDELKGVLKVHLTKMSTAQMMNPKPAN